MCRAADPLPIADTPKYFGSGTIHDPIMMRFPPPVEDRPHLYRSPLTAPRCGRAASIQAPRNGTV